MNIIEQYEAYVASGDWQGALTTVQEILDRRPEIATSWFNLGVCLDALGRHEEAAKGFIKAFRLDETDFGATYRAFRSLTLAENEDAFFNFLDSIVSNFPEIVAILKERKEFQDMTTSSRFLKYLQ